ncbi:MAG TPA: nucleotide-binding protein [Pirellulales bacterium]|nr:nucleotide-binding protein [Pirellulales bacterium]
MTKPRLFVGSARESVSFAYAVQRNLDHDAEVTVWPQGVFNLSAYPVESLLAAAKQTDYAAFAFSPDDVARIRDREQTVTRDNVVFELGLFMGQLDRHRCFVLIPHESDDLHIPTDLYGLTPGKFHARRTDSNLVAGMGAVCDEIRSAMTGTKTLSVARLILLAISTYRIVVCVSLCRIFFWAPPHNS